MDRWITLRELREGAVFENRDGVRAVKSEYHYSNGQCECVLLESGEYAHFPAGNQEPVRELVVAAPEVRGPCGMRYHAADCDCGGTGGDR